VLGDTDRVAAGDLGNGDAAIDRRLEIDVIGAGAGRDRQLELSCLRDALRREGGGPDRL
jgi:hypothetical protein